MTKSIKKLIMPFAAIISTLGVFIIAFSVFLHFTFKDICGNEIHQTILSPNKKLKVVVFQRDCGATTGFSTQISILNENNKLPNEAGNIFRADGHPGDNPIKIIWGNDATIEIQENFVKSYLRKETFKGIQINYNK